MYKRNLIFWFGCILFRVILAVIAYIAPPHILKKLSFITIIPAFNFIFMYLFSIKETKSSRGFFKGKIWWNELRPIHGILYLLFSIYAFREKKFAYKILVLDVIIAIFSKLLYN
tara:strand:- start:246 stop:587 length:342 start_codon:yes stop_codon:yes gene_type:complete